MDKVKLPQKKCLDVQWGTPTMPEDIKKFFFDNHGRAANDIWVKVWVDCDEEPTILDKWIMENHDVVSGEEILLKHWW